MSITAEMKINKSLRQTNMIDALLLSPAESSSVLTAYCTVLRDIITTAGPQIF
jgi:hypothetical protein